MDIGIFIEYNNRVVQIPVNPEKFDVSTSGNNDTVEIIALGEVVIPRQKKLSSISWESFFPYESWFPAIRTKGDFQSASFYVDFINKIRDDCKPCHLTVTGIGFDDDVVIESFDYYHQAGDHEDTYYSISLKRYQPYTVSIVSVTDITAQLNAIGSQGSSTGSSTAASTGSSSQSTSVGVKPQGATVSPDANGITIGCEVYLNGAVHRDSYGASPGKTFTNYKCKVNLMNKKGSHPYHVTTPSGGWLGWVSADSVSFTPKTSSPTSGQVNNYNNYSGTGGGPDRILMVR